MKSNSEETCALSGYENCGGRYGYTLKLPLTADFNRSPVVAFGSHFLAK